MLGIRLLVPCVAIALGACACQAPGGRSVRTLLEARDPGGRTVAGAVVTVDGRPLGLTDHRGLFRLKVRRHAGAVVDLAVVDEEPPHWWHGTFVVGTAGGLGGGDRLVVVLQPGAPPPETSAARVE